MASPADGPGLAREPDFSDTDDSTALRGQQASSGSSTTPLPTATEDADLPATRSWKPTADADSHDDSLLQALVALTYHMECPTSAQALTAGLPLVDGMLTPELFPRAADRAGLSAKLIRRPLTEIDQLTMPCVLLLHGRRACVLLRYTTDGQAQIVLPETGSGTVTIDIDDLAERYSGYAFFAKPTIGFVQREKEVAPERKRHWFWSVLAQNWPIYSEVVVAAVLINSFALASPLFIMNVYDRVVPNNAIETLWVLALGAGIVFVFDFMLKLLRGYFIDVAGKRADLQLASSVFSQVLGIRMMARPASAGAFASNLREFETLRDFFTSATIATIVDLPFIFFFIAIIWLIGGPVAAVPAIAVPVVLAVGIATQAPLNAIVKRTFKEAAQKHGILVEAINGLETIKSIGAEGRMQGNWERFVHATAKSSMQARLLSSVTVNLAASAANVVTIGIVVYGVYLIADGQMTVGALVACTIIGGRAMAPLGQVASLLTRYHQAKTSLDALNGVMALPTERPAGTNFLHRPHLRGEIEFRNVTFTYPNQKLPALAQTSFRIQPGESVGLIGRIGSGKTTIEKMMLGLYHPDQGSVLIDGTDVRQIDPADLRRNVGCVPQDVFLFHGTLRENITLGAPFADDAMVLRAARIAGVDGFASRHPMGYDMNVGERGEQLSGGQRQAVAIARALLLDPPILILDEPTSAMDNSAENRFKAALAENLNDRTLVLVTHRASLLNLVDRLIVMDGGKVVANGPKDQVLQAIASGQIRSEG